MRFARTTGVLAWAARRIREDRLLPVPGAGRGSMAFSVAIVALTIRYHPHTSTSNHGTASVGGVILAAVVIAIFATVAWFRRRSRGNL
jgi:hypothetical protein